MQFSKCLLPALALLLAVYQPAGATVVINEIMNNPAAVSDTSGEWFELLNTGPGDIDLFQWTITDEGSNSHIINDHLLLPAGQYRVLGRNADPASNGGVMVDYQYHGVSLGNGADALVLLDTVGMEQDRVQWDGGPMFPDASGASMYLTDAMLDNNLGKHWAVSTTAFGLGDLGTPGLANMTVATVVPEPASWGLMAAGLLLLLGLQRRQQRSGRA